jgi:hypothetical protein
MRFLRSSTEAYRKAAADVLLAEANDVARQLDLFEKTPILPGNLVEVYIQPPAWSDIEGGFGTISTKDYVYTAGLGNCLWDIAWNRRVYAPEMQRFKDLYARPKAQSDTNAAYRLATNWLSIFGVDVPAMERDSVLKFVVNEEGDQIVPIYWVYWRQPAAASWATISRDSGYDTVAEVWLLEPERRLLQLHVGSSKYLARKPLSVPHRDALLQQTDDELTRQMWFTTSAYREAALSLALREANWMSAALRLSSKPIQASDLSRMNISTPFASDHFGTFGVLYTRDYAFCATVSNRMCRVMRHFEGEDEYIHLGALKAKYPVPKNLVDTNAACALAAKWLAAADVNTEALTRDCAVQVSYWDLGDKFVPLYEVSWRAGGKKSSPSALVVVEPESGLKELTVGDVRYFKRAPLTVPDREKLLGGDRAREFRAAPATSSPSSITNGHANASNGPPASAAGDEASRSSKP